MQPGPDLSEGNAPTVPAPTVTVAGTPRGVVSWSVDREIPGDLPAQVVSGSGLTAAGATVEWSPLETVTSRAASAFARSGGWPPKGGEGVTLDAGYEGAAVRLFTGRIDAVDGGSDGVTTSSFVDRVPNLDRDITIPPLLSTAIPFGSGGPYRLLGLRQETIVNKCLRASGFWATPRPSGHTVVDAPMMGSLGQEDDYGYHTWVSEATPWDTALEYRSSQAPGSRWGLSMSDFRATYPIAGTAKRTLSSGTFVVSFMVDPATQDYATVTCQFAGGAIVVQQMPGTIWVKNSAGNIMTVPVNAGTYDRVAVAITGSTVEVRTAMSTPTGAAAGIGATATAASLPTGDLNHVTVTAMPFTRVAGVQVGWPTDVWRAVEFQRTARLQVGFLFQSLIASPGLQGRNALDLVTEIAQALCAAFWINEHGVAEWRHPDMLRSTPSNAREITSTTSLVDLSWRDSLAALRSKVVVSGDEPHRGFSRGTVDATVWRGPGENVAPGQSVQYIVTPPGDESWFGVAEPRVLASSADFPTFHANRDSWVGAVSEIDGEEAWDGYEVAKAWTQIGVQTWKLVVLNQLASRDATQRVPDTIGMHPRYRGDDLPIVRAVVKTTWVPEDITATANPDTTLPELVHDVGRWVQSGDRQRLADWLAGQLSAPIPEITDLQIVPDPRLQLGDRVQITDPDVTDLSVVGIITGLTITGAAGEIAQSLTVRVVSVSSRLATYLAVQTDNTAQTYAADQTEWDGATYSAHQANPLAK